MSGALSDQSTNGLKVREWERDLLSNPIMTRSIATTIAAVMLPLLGQTSVRHGEIGERSYDPLTVCPLRSCSRRSDQRARRRWDASFQSAVRALTQSRWRNIMRMRLTTRIAMIAASHATYGAIKSYMAIYGQILQRLTCDISHSRSHCGDSRAASPSGARALGRA